MPGIFNLSFGDMTGFNPITGQVYINDTSESNNGDMRQVLAKVVRSVYHFTEFYPDAQVFFKGNTLTRTRLYKMAISIFYEDPQKN